MGALDSIKAFFAGSPEGTPPSTTEGEKKFAETEELESDLAKQRGEGQRDAMSKQNKGEKIDVPLDSLENKPPEQQG